MDNDSSVRAINLNEIDFDVIPKIRPVNDKTEEYRILENAINADGQRNPITIRLLTEAEKNKAHSGAIYGIIDGHHRFHIAQKFNRDTILAQVDDTSSDPIHDAMLAFRMNATSIRMSPAERGKVICDLMKATNCDMNEIGERVFGLRTSMIYRCIQKYKESIGEPTIKKPRKQEQRFEPVVFRDLMKRLSALTNTMSTSNNPWDISGRVHSEDDLKLIKDMKAQLQLLEKQLLENRARMDLPRSVKDMF